jgi:Raf kinase inhibitor-like YbhB/YbcL family protein
MIRAVTMAAVVAAAAAGTMQLQSDDFTAGAALAQVFMATDCGGRNRSPQLTWRNPPPGVKSFALVMHDADAPIAGGFYHWIAYNLPASTYELSSGVALYADQLGKTSLGKPGYYGPCPPPGPAHHYTWTLYALGVDHIAARTPLDNAQLQKQIEGHVLARAVLEATASRP